LSRLSGLYSRNRLHVARSATDYAGGVPVWLELQQTAFQDCQGYAMESHFKLPDRPVTMLALDSTKGMGFQMVRHCLSKCIQHDHTAMKARMLGFRVFCKRLSKLASTSPVTAIELC